MSSPIIWIGMDIHKDTVMVAVFRGDAREAEVVQQLPNDLRKLRRFIQRWQARGEIRTCYEASGAGCADLTSQTVRSLRVSHDQTLELKHPPG